MQLRLSIVPLRAVAPKQACVLTNIRLFSSLPRAASFSTFPSSSTFSRLHLRSGSAVVPYQKRSSSSASHTDTTADLAKKPAKYDINQTSIPHYTQMALLGLIPAALVLSPSALNVPVDLALGVLIPFHAHNGMSLIITDYVTGKGAQTAARGLLWASTILAGLGLLSLNLRGDGLTETVKSLWRPTEKKEEKKEEQKPAPAAKKDYTKGKH